MNTFSIFPFTKYIEKQLCDALTFDIQALNEDIHKHKNPTANASFHTQQLWTNNLFQV